MDSGHSANPEYQSQSVHIKETTTRATTVNKPNSQTQYPRSGWPAGRHAHLFDGDCRLPTLFFVQNRQANRSGGIDIRMEEGRSKLAYIQAKRTTINKRHIHTSSRSTYILVAWKGSLEKGNDISISFFDRFASWNVQTIRESHLKFEDASLPIGLSRGVVVIRTALRERSGEYSLPPFQESRPPTSSGPSFHRCSWLDGRRSPVLEGGLLSIHPFER